MTTTTRPAPAAAAAVPQPRPPTVASQAAPCDVASMQAVPVLAGQAREPLFAMPTARHGTRLVAAITQPGKADGEVVAGPYPATNRSRR